MQAPARPLTPRTLRTRLLPWMVLGLGLAGSALAWALVRDAAQRAERARFDQQVERISATMKGRFAATAQSLYGGRALFARTPDLPQADWAAYAKETLPFLGDGVVCLVVARRIDREQIDALQTRLRSEGLLRFTVQQNGAASKEPKLYVVTHIEPTAIQNGRYGIDLAADPVRRATLQQAMRTGELALSSRIHLVGFDAAIPGFLLTLPVYREGKPTSNEAEREENLLGWVFAVLRADRLMAGIASTQEQHLDLEVFEGSLMSGDKLLFDGDGTALAKDHQVATDQFAGRRFRSQTPLSIYGQTWTVRASSLPGFEESSSTILPLAALGGGIFLTLLSTGLTSVLVGMSNRALRRADDVTEDLRTTEAETRRLALVARHTASAVVLTDVEGKVEWVNESFTRFFGFPLAEVKGLRTDDFLHGPGTAKETVEAMNRARAEGRPFKGELLKFTKQREPRWVELDIQALKDPDGKITAFMALHLDITDRKRIQDELAIKEAQFRFIFESVPVGLSWAVLGKGNMRLVNPAHVRISGVPADRADETDVHLDATHPEDRPIQQVLVERLRRGEIDHYAIEKRYLHPGGTVKWAALTVRHYRDPKTGNVQEIAALVDISDLKRAQEELVRQQARFRFIFEIVPVGLSWFEVGRWRETHIINSAHARITGVSAEKAREPNAYAEVTHPDDRARQSELTARLQKGEIDHFVFEKRYVHPDGKVIWAVLTVRIFRDPVTSELQQVGSLIDITALKQQADDLRGAMDAANSANIAKSQFLAMMSHEIRTPMNGVIGMTSLLLDSRLSTEQRDYVETIRNSGDTLLTIINDILDFSKIESGHMDLESADFALRECVEGALDLLAPRVAEKRLDLLCEIADGVPGTVRGDATRLRQILVNLIGNAVKFTEKGEVVLSVRSTLIGEGPKTELTFDITDTGIGISPEGMGRLFRSFSQVDASTTRKFGGTGLGLAISKRLAELMGGRMWVESEFGKGSVFHFTIVVEALASKPRPWLTAGKSHLAGRRLLIVDDNATNRRILSTLATGWGMVSRAAASGAEAIEWLTAGETFDVGVLDMHMPEMDGMMLAQAIRLQRDEVELPLVLLSSLGIREPGADKKLFAKCLTKPAKPTQLFDALAALFKWAEEKRAATMHPFVRPPLAAAARSEHVLIAEDNVVNQKVVLLMLGKLGFRADVTANGLEAVEALKRQVYDVVLMDVQMPEMDGLEATRRICQLWPDEKKRPWIIALTANAMMGDRDLCMAAGMDDYITKPIKLEELSAALDRARAARAKPV
jgi:PAS domain S-box-containing protein